MKKTLLSLIVGLSLLTGCSGIRSTQDTFSTHAEAFRIIGMAIPADDQAAAERLVPKGATVTSVYSSPADWTSFWGGLGNIFWLHRTTISGTK